MLHVVLAVVQVKHSRGQAKKGLVMHGVDCVFELRKPPNRVQDCRVLVAFVPEWDTYLDALRDAAGIVHSHSQDAFRDGWRIQAIHMRFVDEAVMEILLDQRENGFACDWYGTPCRMIEGDKTLWFGGTNNG